MESINANLKRRTAKMSTLTIEREDSQTRSSEKRQDKNNLQAELQTANATITQFRNEVATYGSKTQHTLLRTQMKLRQSHLEHLHVQKLAEGLHVRVYMVDLEHLDDCIYRKHGDYRVGGTLIEADGCTNLEEFCKSLYEGNLQITLSRLPMCTQRQNLV